MKIDNKDTQSGLEIVIWYVVASGSADDSFGADTLNADDVSDMIARHIETTFNVRTIREASYPTWIVFARTTSGRARLIRASLSAE